MPGDLIRLTIEKPVTLLPEPLSPTKPTISPLPIENERRSSTRATPLRVKNWVSRSRTSSIGVSVRVDGPSLLASIRWSPSAPPRIEHVLQSVTQQIEPEHGPGNRQPGEGVHPPVTLEEVLESELDHCAPFGARGFDSQSDKGQAGGFENGPAELQVSR